MSKLVRSDYLRIKWPIIALVCSVITGLGVYGSLLTLDDNATAILNINRAQLDDAQNRVDLIAEEESTIREYIGRYQQISAAGIVGNEDRLQLFERVAELQQEHSLFPVNVQVTEQKMLPLRYGELSGRPVNEPGRPIALTISSVDITLPLLHENDLNNLLNGLLGDNELLQTRSCSINASGGNYLRLGQHFNAACSLSWYAFAIAPLPAAEAAQ